MASTVRASRRMRGEEKEMVIRGCQIRWWWTGSGPVKLPATNILWIVPGCKGLFWRNTGLGCYLVVASKGLCCHSLVTFVVWLCCMALKLPCSFGWYVLCLKYQQVSMSRGWASEACKVNEEWTKEGHETEKTRKTGVANIHP